MFPRIAKVHSIAAIVADYNCITDQGKPCCGIRAGSAGNLVVTMADGTVETIVAVAAGEVFWIEASLVSATTTVTDLIVYFE